MAFDPSNGYAAGTDDDTALPIFDIQKVQLRFDISADFVAAQVANNVLVLALSTGRILRFDLDNPEDIDDIDLPKRPAEIGVIRRLFLDPSASHLLISTTLGENYYLHTQSRQPKPLGRLKGVQLDSVAWSPSQPTASTREILLGAADGTVYETYIEPSTEFYRSQERYVKMVYNAQAGAVVGLYADVLHARPEARRVLLATQHKLLHFAGRTGKQGHEGSGSIYSKLFDGESPTVHEVEGAAVPSSCLVVSPDSPDAAPATSEAHGVERAYAWLCAQGIFHGKLGATASDLAGLGKQMMRESQLLPVLKLPPVQTAGGRNRTQQPPISSLLLTQFHLLALVEGRVTALNRLDESIAHNQQVLTAGEDCLGLFSDRQKNTFWLFTKREIFEIVVTDEPRDIWKILLKQGQYETSQRYARTTEQKDAVATMTGDHLVSQGKFTEAAAVLGRSSKAFEDVALNFIDKGEHDALRTYLLIKLSTFKKSSTMQRIMLASWLVELFMAKLNQLDDTISTKVEIPTDGAGVSTADVQQQQLPRMRREFQDFCVKHKADLDQKTVYEIIGSHGREDELLFFANTVEDYGYVISYWVQRERWTEAMAVLKKQTGVEMFYSYSTVLMSHVATDLVEVLMRQPALDTKKLIPALLNYNKTVSDTVPLSQNQAVRYLLFCINHSHSTDPAVHNTLISLYAVHATKDEKDLLTYLKAQADAHEQSYNVDFALRLCITHKRVQSCVHIYCTMQQYSSAVELALKYDEIELAAEVADRTENDEALRKKLWLKVAKKVISQTKGIKAAIEFLKRCDGLLRIEDLIPFFPDFVIIDDFKEEICAALEEYSRQIEALKQEMDDSARTAQHIKDDIKALDERYAIVEPGERCWKCRLPLLMRQFFVFPCQHAFHADCLGEMVMGLDGVGKAMVGTSKTKRIRELQREIGRGVALGKRREGMVRELDGLVAGACVLCSEMVVKVISEPFVTPADDQRDWEI